MCCTTCSRNFLGVAGHQDRPGEVPLDVLVTPSSQFVSQGGRAHQPVEGDFEVGVVRGHRPPPERSQCSRVGRHAAFTSTGSPAVHPSITAKENDSKGEGQTSAWAPRSKPHFSSSSTMPVVKRCSGGPEGDRSAARRGPALATGAPLFVRGEGAGEQGGPFELLDPTDAHQVGAIAQAQAARVAAMSPRRSCTPAPNTSWASRLGTGC